MILASLFQMEGKEKKRIAEEIKKREICKEDIKRKEREGKQVLWKF